MWRLPLAHLWSLNHGMPGSLLFVIHFVVDTMYNLNYIMRHFIILAYSVGQMTPILLVFVNFHLKYYVHERMIRYSIRKNVSVEENVKNILIWLFLMLNTPLIQMILNCQITLWNGRDMNMLIILMLHIQRQHQERLS